MTYYNMTFPTIHASDCSRFSLSIISSRRKWRFSGNYNQWYIDSRYPPHQNRDTWHIVLLINIQKPDTWHNVEWCIYICLLINTGRTHDTWSRDIWLVKGVTDQPTKKPVDRHDWASSQYQMACSWRGTWMIVTPCIELHLPGVLD